MRRGTGLVAALALTAAALALAAAGCGSGSSGGAETTPSGAAGETPSATDAATTSAAGNASDTKPVRIAWFGTRANAFLAAELKALQSEAEKLGAEVTVFDSGVDPNKQFSQIQDAITSGKFDGFIVIPWNGAALVPVIEEALAAGIKVVGANAALGPDPNAVGVQIDGVSGQIWTPTVTRGELMGEQMIEACAGIDPCQVAYHAGVAALPIEKTVREGFEKAIEAEPTIDYVGYFDGNGYTVEGGQKVAQDILAANPDIDVIASGDQAALGSALAVRAAGKEPGDGPDEVRILGIGAAGTVLDAVEKGDLFSTQADAPAAEGVISLRAIVDAVKGDLQEPMEVDPIAESGKPWIITKANVSEVEADY
jgi:ribose transport system substrate-binding protein